MARNALRGWVLGLALAGCSSSSPPMPGPGPKDPRELLQDEGRRVLAQVVDYFTSTPTISAYLSMGPPESGLRPARWLAGAGGRARVEIEGRDGVELVLVSDGRAAYYRLRGRELRGAASDEFGADLRGLVGVLGLLPGSSITGGKLQVSDRSLPAWRDMIAKARILRLERDDARGVLVYRLPKHLPDYTLELSFETSTYRPWRRSTSLTIRGDEPIVSREDWETVIRDAAQDEADFKVPS